MSSPSRAERADARDPGPGFHARGRKLFDSASVVIPEGKHVGVVGRNGGGKTTLFRLIRGELTPESGAIETPRRARIGGVAQEAPDGEESLLETVLAADLERAALLDEAETATDPTRIAEIQTRLVDIDAHSAEARAASILAGLGFDEAAQGRPCRSFSGGWRMRVALAAVLFSAAGSSAAGRTDQLSRPGRRVVAGKLSGAVSPHLGSDHQP